MTTTAKYKKYCPNVWLAETTTSYGRGDIIEVENRHGKINEHIVHNLIGERADGTRFYSITRLDGTNAQTVAQRRADKYMGWSQGARTKSNDYYEKSNQHRDFLSLGEPIKIGHHSEKRHRKILDDAYRNMGKSVEMDKKADRHESKADYWSSRTDDINLSMPESIEYFRVMLEEAVEEHRQYKSGEKVREHAYSLAYANKRVKDLKNKYEIALKLWSVEGLDQTQPLWSIVDGDDVLHKDLTMEEAESLLCTTINRGAVDAYITENR